MPKRILIVDDERDLVETLKFRLESAGYDVVTAYDGVEAIKAARETRPDMILLDVMMPKMDGYQACRMLKFSEEFKNTPILMLTARGQDQDRITGKGVGADFYVTKPFDGGELVKKIDGILNR